MNKQNAFGRKYPKYVYINRQNYRFIDNIAMII